MASTTIKVSHATRDRIAAIGARTQQSAERVIQDALDELDRKLFWDRFDAAAAAEGSKSLADETSELDNTLQDGLDD